VDFGCGGGFMLERLNAAERIGIEPNPYARDAAQSRGLRVVASPRELDDGSADVVVSNHALEHALAPYHELRELHRILKSGGRMILWLPLDDWRRLEQRWPSEPDVNHHLYGWTPRLLSNLLTEAGFTVTSVRVVAHAWPPKAAVLRRTLGRRNFDAVAHAWAILGRRRQLCALAFR
jgi:SAM-dependent methyltransferase